jgi:molybdate transport system substrate-binding protein
MKLSFQFLVLCIAIGPIAPGFALAGQVTVAVASNALSAVQAMQAEFENSTGHKLIISSGSTGKLYAQIVNGAPYDVFLAANESEPKRLEKAQLTADKTRFTYALGKLVAWSAQPALLKDHDNMKSLLLSSKRIAIANPRTAPYGMAAKQALQKLGVWGSLQRKIIRGENVSQTYQFAVSANAQIGFVAMSQVMNKINSKEGSYWIVPTELYAPIKQQAVMLKRAASKKAALAYTEFLKSKYTRNLLVKRFGYDVVHREANLN